jgi:hypothetical protein
MTDHPKSSEVAEKRSRVQSAYIWCKPILWGMGIGASLMAVAIAVMVLNQKGFIPSWVFGWISSERETQKRQFRLVLYGLFAFWVAIRLIKFGLFGEVARTTYTGILSKLGFSNRDPDETAHSRICPVRNVRWAVILVGFFTLEVFTSWRSLGKPFVEHNLYDLLFQIVVVSIVLFPACLNISKCLPERFILAIVIIIFVSEWVFEYAPNLANPVEGFIREFDLVLSILAFLTSLSMSVSSLSLKKSA